MVDVLRRRELLHHALGHHADAVRHREVGKDGATTWQRKSLSTQWGSFAFTLALDPATGTVYAGAGRGAYRSDDNGDTWTSIGLDDSPNSVMALGVSAAGDIYAGTSEGLLIHRAADPDPKGWVPTSNDDVSSTQVRRVSILNGNEIFVSVTSMGLYRSANNGADWERLLTVDSRAGTYHDPVTNQIITGTSQGVGLAAGQHRPHGISPDRHTGRCEPHLFLPVKNRSACRSKPGHILLGRPGRDVDAQVP